MKNEKCTMKNEELFIIHYSLNINQSSAPILSGKLLPDDKC